MLAKCGIDERLSIRSCRTRCGKVGCGKLRVLKPVAPGNHGIKCDEVNCVKVRRGRIGLVGKASQHAPI